MERAEVRLIVVEKLLEWGFSAEELEDSKQLAKDLNLDSLDQVDLLMSCEKKVGKKIADNDFEQAKTIGEFIDLFCEK